MKYLVIIYLFISNICIAQTILNNNLSANNDKIKFVNPMVGTHRMGHTYPGATVPFGAVQLSPETSYMNMFKNGKYNSDVYKYCSGYQYADSMIYGFAHTHFSGTGHSDLGDFLIMPTTGTIDWKEPIHSSFNHEEELAQPAYYRVFLKEHRIMAELTATERVGMHQYTFPSTDSAKIILDLMYNIYNHDDKDVWSFLRVENDSTITGYRQTTGWGRTRTVYFAMQFSKKFNSYGQYKLSSQIYSGFYGRFNEKLNFPEMAGKNIKAFFNFSSQDQEKIIVKFALSSVSSDGALQNLKTELPHWNFKQVVTQSQQKWNKELSKIDVESLSNDDKQTFYTALYHTMLSPTIYEDVDGKYRGLDQNIHESNGFTNYTTFSLWDTYRALHPLFNIIEPTRNNDMVKSMLAHQSQSVHHMLPIWSHYNNENWCMIGYHAVSVLADAIAKGTTDADLQLMLSACIATSNVDYFDGIGYYKKLGYVPEDKSGNSVSKTLEYAYNDWCIAQIALRAKDSIQYHNYMDRSNNYKNVFDASINSMRPKLANGNFRAEFDPKDTHGQGFIEGNALNYGLYVPHDIPKMIEMMGGKDKFESFLDSIFLQKLEDKYIEKNEDITRDGIIGSYVHGNEPGHQIAYLYNWTNHPSKTQERVRMIQKTMYSNTKDGLCGNDDAGQMSAWYIFSALGFYPVLPGSDNYEFGSPSIKSALIHLENGKTFHVKTFNQSPENVYVQKIELNNKELNRNYLLHSEINNGSELVFYMGKNKKK